MSGQAVSIDWNLDVDSLADQLLLGKPQAKTSAHVSILDEPLQGFCSPATLTPQILPSTQKTVPRYTQSETSVAVSILDEPLLGHCFPATLVPQILPLHSSRGMTSERLQNWQSEFFPRNHSTKSDHFPQK